MRTDYATTKRRPVTVEPHCETKLITPALAAEWLEKNTNNRPLNRANFERIKDEMRAGRFLMNGDGIRFDVHGGLLDGQHRLMACVETGVSFVSAVWYNLPVSVRATIDIGAGRTTAHVLRLEGFENEYHLASGITSLLNYRAQRGTFPTLPKGEILEAVASHSGIVESIHAMKRVPPGMPKSHLYAVHYLTDKVLDRPDRAADLVDVFVRGTPLYKGDPVHLFREKVIRLRGEKVRTRSERLLWTLIDCVNEQWRGTKRSRIQWTDEPTRLTGLDHDVL